MGTDYQRHETSTTVRHYPRPLGHKVRSFVLLIGIWFYFLFVVCIPEANKHDRTERKLVSVGSGVLQGCAFIICFFAMWGLRRTGATKIIAFVLLGLMCLGSGLLAIGRGQQTTDIFDWTKDDYIRMRMVGTLIGEVAYATAGVLIVLPDLGILCDWSS